MKVYWIEVMDKDGDCYPYLKGKRNNSLNNYNTKQDALLDLNELVDYMKNHKKYNSSLVMLNRTTDCEYDDRVKTIEIK